MGSKVILKPTKYALPAEIKEVCENLPKGSPAKVPPQIPSEWKNCANAFNCHPQWCRSLTWVLWRYRITEAVTERLSTTPISTQLLDTSETIHRASRWAKTGELPPPKKWGGYKTEPCANGNPLKECIIVNRAVYGPDGDRRGILDSNITIRQLTLPHEGAHKLIRAVKLDAESNHDTNPFLARPEEELVLYALTAFVQGNPQSDSIAPELGELFGTCLVPPHCATPKATTEKKQGGLMGTPHIKSVSTSRVVDFNNDNLPDAVMADPMSSVPNKQRPYLRGESSEFFPLSTYSNTCHVDGTIPPGQLWEMDGTHYRAWREDFKFGFLRFFNSQRTMSFVPGDPVGLKTDGAAKTLQSLVVIYDSSKKNPKPKVLALLSDCQVAELENLVEVTTSGQRLDMQRAISLAGFVTPSSPPASGPPSHAEIEMGEFLKIAAQQLISLRQSSETEPSCMNVLASVPEAPITKQLHDGWEKSVCFILGLSPYAAKSQAPGGGLEEPQGASLER